MNDLKPPTVKVLTQSLSAGRPTILIRVTDAKSGVDPLSLQLYFGPTGRQSSVAASYYDPTAGIAAFEIPRSADRLQPGPQFMQVVASDNQESKNISSGDTGSSPLPNTRFAGLRALAVNGPTVTWATPGKNTCASRRQSLLVVANDSAQISSVAFFDGKRQIARVRKNTGGLYRTTWHPRKKGAHVLSATASDVRGREATASQHVRVCR